MYKILSNKAVTYSCTCPQCNSYFLFTQSELKYSDEFSNFAYFICPCCGANLRQDKAVRMSNAHGFFNEAII